MVSENQTSFESLKMEMDKLKQQFRTSRESCEMAKRDFKNTKLDVQESVVKVITDQLVASEGKCKEHEERIIELEDALASREAQLADFQVSDFKMKKKCEELSAAGEKYKELRAELMDLQKSLKSQRLQLMHIKSSKKNLKRTSRQLLLAAEKCQRLKAALKMSKDAHKIRNVEANAAMEKCKKLEESLKTLQAERNKSSKKSPRFTPQLITLSVSVTILTSLFVLRKVL